MKGRSRGGFTASDFGATTWLGEPVSKFCPTCDSRIVDGRGITHPCPICDDTRSAA